MKTLTRQQASEFLSGAWPAESSDELRDDLDGFLAADAETDMEGDSDYGGAFDGFTVTSDADPGL